MSKVRCIIITSERSNRVKTFLDEKRSTSERNVEDVEVIDEEEFAAIKELKDLKTLYREKHKEWKELKDRKTHVELLVDACRIELVNKFEDWLEKNYGVTRTMKSSNERLSPEKNRVIPYGLLSWFSYHVCRIKMFLIRTRSLIS